jgi:hypothetical protein
VRDKICSIGNLDLFIKHIYWMEQKENKTQLRKIYFDVVQYFMFPDECLHVKIKRMFQAPGTPQDIGDCGECLFCSGKHKQHTGIFRRGKLKSALIVAFTKGPQPTRSKCVVAALKKKKKDIWTDPASTVDAGMIQSLVIQLVMKGIVHMDYKTCRISWMILRDELVSDDENSWDGMTFIN